MSIKKSICTALIAATVVLSMCALSASAKPTYGSKVNTAGWGKYGVAWTSSTGDTVGARIVIFGDVSDLTKTSYAQTEQVSGPRFSTAYVAHTVNGKGYANYKK